MKPRLRFHAHLIICSSANVNLRDRDKLDWQNTISTLSCDFLTTGSGTMVILVMLSMMLIMTWRWWWWCCWWRWKWYLSTSDHSISARSMRRLLDCHWIANGSFVLPYSAKQWYCVLYFLHSFCWKRVHIVNTVVECKMEVMIVNLPSLFAPHLLYCTH